MKMQIRKRSNENTNIILVDLVITNRHIEKLAFLGKYIT